MTSRDSFQRIVWASAVAFALTVPVSALADAIPVIDRTTDIMHARYYSPSLGRFVSVDPVGGRIGNSQSWNRYSYVLNNPIGLVDPTGAIPVIPIVVWAFVGGLVGAEWANTPTGPDDPVMTDPAYQNNGQGLMEGTLIGGVVGVAYEMVSSHDSPEAAPELAPSHDSPGGRSTPSPPTPPGAGDQSPGEGWEWRGQPDSQPGDKQGSWYNPETGEVMRPDLDHPEPIPPHWDYKDPETGEWWRVFPDGGVEPKKS